MKLNLRTKLIGSFVIVLLLMIVVGLVGVYTSKYIQDHLQETVEQEVKAANILGVVARRAGFIHSNALLHLITRSIDDMDRYESEVADWVGRIDTDLDTLENTFKDQATLDKLAEFRAAWETCLRIWNEQVVPLSRANRDDEAFALVRKEGVSGTAAQEMMYKLDELHDALIATADESLELAEQNFGRGRYILLTVTLLAIILGLAFGIKQSSLIADAVNTVSKAAQRVAAGDLDQSVTLKTGDEIEAMADSFNTMTGNMKKMVEELQHEITERKQAEEALARSNAELAVANEELEAFSYSVSHDLRTPLRTVDGFSQVLLEGYSEIVDEQGQHYLRRVRAGAQNMSRLIDDLLALSRIGRQPMNRKTIELETIVQKAYSSLEDEWKDREVNLSLDWCPPVFADPHLVQIVFTNLLSNALKFTRNRAPAEIKVGYKGKDERAILFVKDTGVGFDMKYVDKLFAPFQRLHRPEEYEGTGIGLATVQRIIHRHGGRIWAESKPGTGTTFYFTLQGGEHES